MKKLYLKIISILTIIPSIFIYNACSSSDDIVSQLVEDGLIQTNVITASDMLTGISAGITSGFEDFSEKTSDLETSIENFCSNINEENLITAQNHWRDAKLQFKRVELFSFGPLVGSASLIGAFDFWPPRSQDIETALVNNDDFSKETLNQISGRIRGLPVLEYLLFDVNDDNQNILDNMTEKRCSFSIAVSGKLAIDAEGVYEQWSINGGNFSAELSNAGNGSQTYESESEAIGALVNEMGTFIGIIKDSKISKPLGLTTDQINVDILEAKLSGTSLESMIANLESFKSFYNGTFTTLETPSFYQFLSFRNQSLADQLSNLIDSSITNLELIPSPLSETLIDESTQDQLLIALNSIRDLKALISSELTSELGVTIFFNDADGD
jgi:predicted lipoprotein